MVDENNERLNKYDVKLSMSAICERLKVNKFDISSKVYDASDRNPLPHNLIMTAALLAPVIGPYESE